MAGDPGLGHPLRVRTVEIQSLNGDLGEIDSDAWLVLPLSYAEQPEDGSVCADEVEADDFAAARAESILEDPAVLAQLA